MEKLSLLRQHLLASVPALAENPDRLLLFVESGTIEFRPGSAPPAAAGRPTYNLTHEWVCPVRLVVVDWSGSLDPLLLPLLAWLAHYQPNLPKDRPIAVEAEITAAERADLSLSFRLTERVVVKEDPASGAFACEHRIPEYPRDPGTDPPPAALYATGPDGAAVLVSEAAED